MHEVDKLVFGWINRWPEAWRGMFVFLSEATKGTGVRLAILALVLAMVAMAKRTREAVIQVVIAVALSDSSTHLLKLSIPWLRPCNELTDAILRVGRLDSYGTASAHSANMAAVATVLVGRLGWYGSPWILVAILTGLSRVYVGVHYPLQVLLGWTIGVLLGILVLKTWDAILAKRNHVRSGDEDKPIGEPPR